MLIGVAFYSLVIGIISAFFTNKDTKQSLLKKRLQMVEEFCKNLNIGKDLEGKLKESIIYSSDKLAYLWLSPSEDIFSELSMQLKYDFLVAIYQDLIKDCEFFKNKDISFIVRVVPLLKPVKYKSGGMIYTPGDYSSCIYFLTEGEVTFYTKKQLVTQEQKKQMMKQDAKMLKQYSFDGNKTSFVNKILKSVTYFGEVDIILKKNRRYFAQASNDCHLMILSRTDFESIVQQEFPQNFHEILDVALSRYESDLKVTAEIRNLIARRGLIHIPDSKVDEDIAEEKNINRLNVKTSDLYEQSKDHFPIEDLLKEVEKRKDVQSKLEITDINLSKWNDEEEAELDILMGELEDCQRQLRTKLEAEDKIKKDLKENFETNNIAGAGSNTDIKNKLSKVLKASAADGSPTADNIVSKSMLLKAHLEQLMNAAYGIRKDNFKLEKQIDTMIDLLLESNHKFK